MGRQPCCDKVGVKRGPWTAEEDQKLVGFILTHGHCCWRVVPKLAGLLRCGKSCRLRWTNYLRPDLKRGLLDDDEERLVIDLHAQLGNRWSKIAARLPGRTDNEIKNHWNTHIRKKLLRMGIDPVTHLPLHQQAAAPPAPPPQEQEHHHQPPPPPQNDGAGEEDLPVVQPQEISSAGSGGSGAASVVSPSCSSSASAPAAHGVEATEWPEDIMFGMDAIMDAGWDGLFPCDGGGIDPFDGFYPGGGGGFDQDDGWM
ncbi:unnamed protein product [Urochloa humidicola]